MFFCIIQLVQGIFPHIWIEFEAIFCLLWAGFGLWTVVMPQRFFGTAAGMQRRFFDPWVLQFGLMIDSLFFFFEFILVDYGWFCIDCWHSLGCFTIMTFHNVINSNITNKCRILTYHGSKLRLCTLSLKDFLVLSKACLSFE